MRLAGSFGICLGNFINDVDIMVTDAVEFAKRLSKKPVPKIPRKNFPIIP